MKGPLRNLKLYARPLACPQLTCQEPAFKTSLIKVTDLPTDRSVLAPGYIFTAPHIAGLGWGPQVFDDAGALVWSGQEDVDMFKGKKDAAMGLRVCDYLGEEGNHLCFSEAMSKGPEHTASQDRILDQHYQPVNIGDHISKVGHFTFPNTHEFNMLPGGESLLQAVYKLRTMDLRPYAGRSQGKVLDGCFQEVDVRSGNELFRWCFLDHYPIWETYLYLHIPQNTVNASTAVSGMGNERHPWDFMHINSVDKNEEGDYLISGRHLNQILKVAGINSPSGLEPGEVIWRLGGKHGEFDLGDGAFFARQHHVRFVSTSHDETQLTVFNNAWEGVTESVVDHSSGLLLSVNNVTKTATLVTEYAHPYGKLAYKAGSIQVLPNGNVHVGWGGQPGWSEFSANGTMLSHAILSRGVPESYRSFKYEWTGRPLMRPKILPYCAKCAFGDDAPLIAYVSWNGDTRVRQWRFHVSSSTAHGPWIPAGTFDRDGFETRAALRLDALSAIAPFAPWVSVEGLDANGEVLGDSVAETWVPGGQASEWCGIDGCSQPRFAYPAQMSRGRTCQGSLVPSFIALFFVILGVESFAHMMDGVWPTLARGGSQRFQYEPFDEYVDLEESLASREASREVQRVTARRDEKPVVLRASATAL